MPNWLIAIISAVLAGLIGFTCGALVYKPQWTENRSTVTAAEQKVETLKTENAALNQQLSKLSPDPINADPQNPTCIFTLNKPQLIAYCQSKGLKIKSDPYNIDDQYIYFNTIFPLDNRAFLKLTWLHPNYNRLESIRIVDPDIENSPERIQRCLDTWNKLDPGIVELFRSLPTINDKDYRPGLRWYKDTPYAYGSHLNNNYLVEYVGPRSAIPELKKHQDMATIIYFSWYNYIENSRLKMNKKLESISNKKDFIKLLIDEISDIGFKFGYVYLSELDCDSPAYVWDEHVFQSNIPRCFNEKAKETLIKTAGAAERLAFLASQLLKCNDNLEFRVYDELKSIVLNAGDADSQVWGNYRRLAEYKELSKRSPELDQRLYDLVSEALAIQMFRGKKP